MSKVEETYLYSVMNRGPIKLSRGIEIRSAKSLYLTKEDVLECLKKAHVYRRFANPPGKQELVTTANIDRLHRANYISEEEWKANGNKITNTFVDEFVLVESKPNTVEIKLAKVVKTEPEITEEIQEEEIIELPKTAEEIENSEPAALDSANGLAADEEQEDSVDDAAKDIVPDVVEEQDDIEVEEETNNLDLAEGAFFGEIVSGTVVAESLEEVDNVETGVSNESSTKQSQPSTVKYNYHKKNKHNKK